MTNNARIPLLDLFRFCAAMSVVFFHYWSNHLFDSRFNLVYGQIFEFPKIEPIVKYGALGVDLFFLISGFVIALSAEGRSFASFCASRITRIIPTYWLAIILTSSFILIEGNISQISIRQILANLFMLQSALGEKDIDGVYWTILIEIRFYILVGFLILCKSYKHYHWFLLFWITLCFADFKGLSIGPLRQIFITSWGFYFAAGGAFYFLYKRQHIILSLLTILISLLIAVSKQSELFIKIGTEESIQTAQSLIIGCYLLMAVIATKWLDNLNWNWLPIAGGLTYPLYLIHEVIGFILMRHLNVTNNGFILTLIIITLMLVASWIINHCFEQKICPPLRKFIEEFNINLFLKIKSFQTQKSSK